MVQRCCVPLCETKVGDADIKGVKVRFHRIPTMAEKVLKWKTQITNSGEYVPEPELTVNSRVCSKHFLRDDYIQVDNQKPGTAGNHVLTADAVPSVFKWNDTTGNKCEVSRAIPYVNKKVVAQGDPTRNQEVQCSIEEDRLNQEIFRKNMIIRQLLQRLAEIEGQQVPIDKTLINPTIGHKSFDLAKDVQDEGENSNSKRKVATEIDLFQEPPRKVQVIHQAMDLSLK